MVNKITATEARIKTAFLELLKTKTFEKISVSDISKAAGINRGTFYLHYVDKYALREHYEDELIDQVKRFYQEDFQETMVYQSVKANGVFTYPVVKDIVDLVAAEFELFKALLGPTGDPHFELQLKQMLRAAIAVRIDHIKGQLTMAKYIPEDYAWELIISGLFSIIKVWMQTSQADKAPEVCAIIMKTRFLSPYDLLGISD
ncbi:TetR/AcrR family transcriptional regulator [Lacticaseibacillus zhaodongensis]|uniref:TetR/AcrR family transcriptional regulator n=1 Tax=Lacticaseibacillus zhaodongensis TaxID=2668065 RepID=UPI0018AF607D|nr:TetR/AcrR family transcriptional regulator C-terminal domain-containing protein [Lacticaseibacillus zhaodongensis]